MKNTLSPRKDRKKSSINLWFVVILLLGIALKTVYLYSYAKNSPFYSNLRMDSAIYLNWANIINQEGWLGKEIFYWAPLYPYLLNITLNIFNDTLLGIYWVQWAMGLCSIGFIYLIGRRVYNERAGILAAGFALAYAPLTFFETKVLPTVTGVFLGLVFMVLLTKAEQEKKWLFWLTGSVALGFAIVCRPNYLLVIPLMAAGLLMGSRKHLKDAVLPILTVIIIPCVIVGAITMRNYFVGNDWVIISSNAGVTFAQGNNPGAHGRMTILPGFSGMVVNQRQEETRIAEAAMGRKLKVSEINRFWFRQGLSFVQEQPWAYLRLLRNKTLMAVNCLELGSNYLLSIDKALTPCLTLAFLPFGFIMAWAVVGLASIFRERRQGLTVLATFFCGFATLLIFYVNTRYRMALVPAAAIMAGGGVDYLLRSTSWKGSISTLLMVTVLVIISLPTFMPLTRHKLDQVHAGYWSVLGNSFRKANKLDQALWAYDQALSLDPQNHSYYLDKVEILTAMGSDKTEIILWAEKTGRNITPEYMRYLFLAKSYYMVQDETRAEDHIQKLLALNIDDYKLYLKLGILYGNLRNNTKAKEMFARGLQLNPDNGDLQINYAIASFMTGDTLESMKWAEKVVEKAPYDNRARLLLEEIAKHRPMGASQYGPAEH